MATETLESRVATLEAEVKRLKLQMAQETGAVSGKTAPDFLDRFSGIFANDPTFEEAVRLGKEWRYADHPDHVNPSLEKGRE